MTLDISPEDALRELARRTNAYDPTVAPKWSSGAQKRLIESDSKKLAVVAGWQSGKTTGGVRALKKRMYRYGPGDYLACAPTFRLLDKKVLPELKQILKGLADWRASDGLFEFSKEGKARWGFTEELRLYTGFAENPDSLESATYKAVYGDEVDAKAFPQESHQVLTSRLLVHDGALIYTSRPYRLDWYHDFTKQKGVEVIQFPSWENPALRDTDWDALRESMPSWIFDMKYGGLFTKGLGTVYDCFDRNEHVIPDTSCPEDGTLYCGMDFGPVNFAAVFVLKTLTEKAPGWKLTVVDTYFAGDRNAGRTIKQHVEAMRKIVSPFTYPGQRVQTWGGAPSEDDSRHEFARAGWPVSQPPVSEFGVGVQRVYSQIATGQVKFLRNGAARAIEEIERYSYALDKDDPETVLDDKPLDKQKYHVADALRYVVTGLCPERKDGETTQPRRFGDQAVKRPSRF